jgi:hypothetical protein
MVASGKVKGAGKDELTNGLGGRNLTSGLGTDSYGFSLFYNAVVKERTT